jgi:hypothetical protein
MEEQDSQSGSGEWEALEAPITLVQQYLRSMSTQVTLQRKLDERSEHMLNVIERCVEASRSSRAVQLRRILLVQAVARARESARNVAIRRTLLQADPKVRQLLRQMLGMPGEDGEPEEGTKAFLTERAIAAKKEKLQAAVKRRQSTMVGNAASAAALQRASQRSLLAVLKSGTGPASAPGLGVDRQSQTYLPPTSGTGSTGRIGEFHTRFDESPLLGMGTASKKLYESMKRKEQLRERMKNQSGDHSNAATTTELSFKRSPSTTEPLVVERPITAPPGGHQSRQEVSAIHGAGGTHSAHSMEEPQQSVLRQALESAKKAGGSAFHASHHADHDTTNDTAQQPQAISQTVLINELNHLLLATHRCRSAQRSKRSAAPIQDPQTISPYEIVRRGQELVNLSLASADGKLGAKAPFDNDGHWESVARPQTAPIATAGTSGAHRPPLSRSEHTNDPSSGHPNEGVPPKKFQSNSLTVEAELAELLWSGSAFHTVQRLAKLRESLAGNGSWGVALHTTASPTPGPGPMAASMSRPRTAAAATAGRRPVVLGQLKGQRPPTPTAWPHPFIVVPVRQER